MTTNVADQRLMDQLSALIVTNLREVEPGYIRGTLSINGADHHFELIQVVADSQTGEQHATGAEVNHERYDDMQTAYDGIYETIDLDGRQFVCRVIPYCR